MGEQNEGKIIQNGVEPTESSVDDVEQIRKALEEEKAKAEANLAGWQRAQADFINYKRRMEQEREETSKFAKAGLVCNILPALDDLDRAFDSIPAHLQTEAWIEGVRLIERKLRSCLEAEGLCKIDAMGESFDPNIHEAVKQDKGKEGIVVGEMLKGYKFKDKVIRPSKVIVGSGEDENQGNSGRGEQKEE